MLHKIKHLIKKKLTKLYWKSDISSKWHNARKDDSFHDFEAIASKIHEKAAPLKFEIVIEVGTGAGILITLLSKKLNSYKKFIGIDINKHQINRNTIFYKELNNVEFIYANIEKYVQNHTLDNVVLVAQNTFDYFPQEDLQKLFLLLHSKIENIAIIISSSIKNLNIENSINRDNSDFKLYDHNYAYLLKVAGYDPVDIDYYSDNNDSIIISGYKTSKKK